MIIYFCFELFRRLPLNGSLIKAHSKRILLSHEVKGELKILFFITWALTTSEILDVILETISWILFFSFLKTRLFLAHQTFQIMMEELTSQIMEKKASVNNLGQELKTCNKVELSKEYQWSLCIIEVQHSWAKWHWRRRWSEDSKDRSQRTHLKGWGRPRKESLTLERILPWRTSQAKAPSFEGLPLSNIRRSP